MSDLFKDTERQLELIRSLDDYEIEFGVLKGDQYVTVAVLHGDGSKTEYAVPVEDIVYMAEYGTISFSGMHILQVILYWVGGQLNVQLEQIIDNILTRDWDESDIRIEMAKLENFINNYIRSYISSQIKEMTYLADKTGQKGLIDFPVNIALLNRYISCKISKRI